MKELKVNEILFDLYMVDENLKEYEEELKDIILEVYHSKPNTDFDEIFKQNLKEEILIKIQSLKRDNLNRKINLSNDLPKESNIILFMKKFNYILGGAGISTLTILVVAYFMINSGQLILKDNLENVNKNSSPDFLQNEIKDQIIDISIKNIGKNAFGEIKMSEMREFSNNQKDAGNSNLSIATEQTIEKSETPLLITKIALDENSENINTPYTPEYYTYNYTDSIDKLNYSIDGLEVLKKINSNSTNFDYKNVNISNLNLSQFNNLKLNNLALDEDKENGYSIYFNFNDGSLSINKNWQKWPNVNYDKNLKISDIPSDESIIKIANDFVFKYNINTKNYGKPEIVNDWKQYYEQSEDKNNYYIPNSIGVIYPLIINGKQVYESYGGKVGMTVNVDVLSKKVDSLYGIQTQNYESSKYDLETDPNKLLEIIKIGGEVFYPKYSLESNAKEISSNVKNPSISYMRTYKYNNNTSFELYIPAMILDIENTINNNYRKNIVIPLTKDSIEEILKNNKEQPVINELPQPKTDIMPLKK